MDDHPPGKCMNRLIHRRAFGAALHSSHSVHYVHKETCTEDAFHTGI